MIRSYQFENREKTKPKKKVYRKRKFRKKTLRCWTSESGRRRKFTKKA